MSRYRIELTFRVTEIKGQYDALEVGRYEVTDMVGPKEPIDQALAHLASKALGRVEQQIAERDAAADEAQDKAEGIL